MSIARLMRHEVNVYSDTPSFDTATGTMKKSLSMTIEGLRCNVQKTNDEIRNAYLQRDEFPEYSVYWIANDVISINQIVQWQGKNYRVIGLWEETQRNTYKRVEIALEQS